MNSTDLKSQVLDKVRNASDEQLLQILSIFKTDSTPASNKRARLDLDNDDDNDVVFLGTTSTSDSDSDSDSDSGSDVFHLYDEKEFLPPVHMKDLDITAQKDIKRIYTNNKRRLMREYNYKTFYDYAKAKKWEDDDEDNNLFFVRVYTSARVWERIQFQGNLHEVYGITVEIPESPSGAFKIHSIELFKTAWKIKN